MGFVSIDPLEMAIKERSGTQGRWYMPVHLLRVVIFGFGQ